MTGAELDTLADKVADRLREPMISAALPAWADALLREAGRHGQWNYRLLVPLHNGYGINTEWTISPDGSLTLRLQDVNGQRFWQGTFRGVEEAS